MAGGKLSSNAQSWSLRDLSPNDVDFPVGSGNMTERGGSSVKLSLRVLWRLHQLESRQYLHEEEALDVSLICHLPR